MGVLEYNCGFSGWDDDGNDDGEVDQEDDD